MLWLKAWHIIFVVTWFAGLFYLPRLFVYHATAQDAVSHERFIVMERKLYAIMSIGAILAIGFGLWLLARHWPVYSASGWLAVKLVLVAGLVGYHLYCGYLLRRFRAGANRHGPLFYRGLNEVPAIALIAIVLLAVVKPF